MAQKTKAGSAQPLVWALALTAGLSGTALAQNFPISPAQRATAQQVAQGGVPLSELSESAPDSYTVKSGDTLWGISGLFLKSPWRWPELWGMNLEDIRNPHRIFPGQQLFLVKANGRASLSTRAPSDDSEIPTVKVSPRTRVEALSSTSLPTIPINLIEPFLAEPLIVEEGDLLKAPRIVGTRDERVLLSRGDRGYARGSDGPLLDPGSGKRVYRVFRNATPQRDPDTNTILGYEAQFVGRAELIRPESSREITGKDGKKQLQVEPATIDITASKEEMRVGDRLVPEPPRDLTSFVPRAPEKNIEARIVSVYGNAVANASQNQVVLINKGTRDGIAAGQVFAILKDGMVMVDRTSADKASIKLPNERNGLLMVFRPFDKMAYALVLDITDAVNVGDRLVNPR
jgi:hypothetical protein